MRVQTRLKEKKLTALKLLREGVTPSIISERLDLRIHTIRYWAKGENIKWRTGRSTVFKNIELEKILLKHIKLKTPIYKVCCLLGISYNVITYWEQQTGNKLFRTDYSSNLKSRLKKELPKIDLVEYVPQGSSKFKCKKGHIFERNLSNIWKNWGCPKCNPKSKVQKDVVNWLRVEGYECEENKRILKVSGETNKLEVDILLPKLNLGIEIHGLYWHSEEFVESKYHQKKALAAEAQGLKLLQFFCKEWKEKQDIVKSIILANLNSAKTIYARKLKVIELSNSEYKTFVTENHLQGFIPASTKLGLKDLKGELYAVMSFRKNKKGYELARFCNKLNFLVVGGFSKLLKHAKIPGDLISFCDLRYASGKAYASNGFEKLYITSPDWFWHRRGEVYNRRLSWSKKDSDIRALGYQKVYGAGNIKFRRQVVCLK